MPRVRTTRLYWRDQGGTRRAYGDFRDYSDVGGGREALIPEGLRQATSDPDVAQALVTARIKDLEAKRRGVAIIGDVKRSGLATFARDYLIQKKKAGKATDKELGKIEQRLTNAIAFFEARKGETDPDLLSIETEDVEAWIDHLRETLPVRSRNGEKKARPADGTIRHYLMSLSGLYTRAIQRGYAAWNPVKGLGDDMPQVSIGEATFMEVHEAALLLEAARLYVPAQSNYIQCAYPLIAALLLTGGREREVFGLEIRDVSFDRETVTFRPNKWRDLKTRHSARTVTLWPQLAEILAVYLAGKHAPKGTLLFPSARGDEKMIYDERKLLESLTELSGLKLHLSAHVFRHTYCAARLQTLDHGEPVSPFTVGRELGHGGESLVKRVYGHLGKVRHRSNVVEYRVEQHKLGQQVEAMKKRAALQKQPA